MISFDVLPRFGLGPVHLSSPQAAVRQTLADLGFPLSHSRRYVDYFCSNALQVEYGSDWAADFIGVAAGSNDDLRVLYAGIDVFDTPADQVFASIAAREGGVALEFNPRGCRFPVQIVTLDDQYDHRGRSRGRSRWPVWGQVGVGSERYLKAVTAIEAESASRVGRRR